ncbi:MAG TPA: hypothetical protein VHZ99_04525 [Steroidobacteraceae bacterium]|jgi:hypothetical protein|nr:hypothetical protein [Steroidobacteraceae bacterium]
MPDELEKARDDLKDVQSRAAAELAEKGHASEKTDDEVAGTLQRIRRATEKE